MSYKRKAKQASKQSKQGIIRTAHHRTLPNVTQHVLCSIACTMLMHYNNVWLAQQCQRVLLRALCLLDAGGAPQAPRPPPPTQRKRGTIRSRRCYIILLYPLPPLGKNPLRAFGKNIWGKVSQKVVLTCDCVIAGCFDKAKGL